MTDKLYSSTPTPLTPPKLEEDRLSWLRLFRSRRVGVATFYRLLAEHGSAAAALEALPGIARAAGVEDYAPCPVDVARAEMRAGQKAGARLVCRGDPAYPAALAEIDDAPPLFWARGNLALLKRPMIALVGARNASSLGERMARSLARDLAAQGFVIVSGLARGIDAAAHAASLDSGTVAVLAGGVDIAYPAESRQIFQGISERGLCLSEQVMGLEPQARHFPPRNRIISGLSSGIVVVEAAARSGSLITARNALDQGREVMAVPGHPFDARAGGCNMLIRDGALLVRSAADILETLGVAAGGSWREEAALHQRKIAEADAARAEASNDTAPMAANGVHRPSEVPTRPLKDTAALHRDILSRLGPSPLAEDQLIRDLDLPAQRLAPVLLALELEGRIQRQPGGLLARIV